jgi:acetate kinase
MPAGAGASHASAVGWLLDRLGDAPGVAVAAAGHRVVHGGERFAAPCLIDAEVEAGIETLVPLARLHNPHNLAAIRAVRAAWPDLPQVACFDTGFHATQPPLATTFALPEAVRRKGVRRYGFHGISYESVALRLSALAGARAFGRVIVAHLGNGASLCAMHGLESVATTMGMTPLDGLVMGTRPGLLDPGVVLHLQSEMGLSVDTVVRMLNRESGLLGLAGLSDMRALEEAGTPEARFAIDLFCYRVAREIGSLAAALGGLDLLVFTGGIGENGVGVRADIMRRCNWLGVELDMDANRMARAVDGSRISTTGSRVAARVMEPREEELIARRTWELVAG